MARQGGHARVRPALTAVRRTGQERPRDLAPMLELLVVLLVLGTLGFSAVVVMTFTASLVAALGFSLLVLGLILGVPTGFWYHVALYRSLTPRMPLPARWWWAPAGLHRHLTDAERRHITLWYRLGGVGFGLCIAGGLTALAGLLAGR